MEDILLYFALKYNGDFTRIYEALEHHEKCDFTLVAKQKKELTCKYITILSPDYPKKLKQSVTPPFVLFYYGNLDLLKEPSLGVIGSRKNSNYGKRICEETIPEIVKNNFVIISGLAKGIDSIAHRICLANHGKTISVLGNGVEQYYPLENKELQELIKNEGLLISEYPPFVSSTKDKFPTRNRIIAALSDSLLVVEAKKQSGTMTTVNAALSDGKEIMCFPTMAYGDSGCNELIKNGAYLVENSKDILEIIKK